MNEESSSSFLDMLEDLVYEYLCKYDGKDEWPNTDGDRQTSQAYDDSRSSQAYDGEEEWPNADGDRQTSQAYDGEEEEDAPDLVDGHDSGDGWW